VSESSPAFGNPIVERGRMPHLSRNKFAHSILIALKRVHIILLWNKFKLHFAQISSARFLQSDNSPWAILNCHF
jgi:hypothetical protein